MSLLIINSGSSSLRVAMYDTSQGRPVLRARSRYDLRAIAAEDALRTFIEQEKIETPLTVAHRFVHGGARFFSPVVVTRKTSVKLKKLVPLAPLHNPVALELMAEAERQFENNVTQIAVFDTGYFHDLPLVAKTYALPAALCIQNGLYRYGFHGFAHQSLYQQWRELTDKKDKPSRVITVQLGSGCSITAIREGKPQDTSMGFTPLEGLVMGTRSGDLDPGILIYLQREMGYTIEQLDILLNEQSGLLGLSGETADMRQLVDASSDMAQLAIEIFCYRVRKYIGSYLAVLGGADAIVLGGGIGENMPVIRAKILENMNWCGLQMDQEKNNQCIGKNACISREGSDVEAWAIRTDEEQLIAESVCSFLSK